MRSLAAKFMLAISILISLVLIANAVYLENQQRIELKRAISAKAISYAELGHPTIGEDFSLYYESGYLNLVNSIRDQMQLNADIIRLQLINYNGEVLLDDLDQEPRYLTIADRPQELVPKHLLPKVQGRFDLNPNNDLPDSVSEIVLAEDEIRALKLDPRFTGQNLLEIVYPFYDSNQRHVVTLRYLFSFENLQAAILRMRMAVAGLTLLSILAGIIMAMLLVGNIVRPIRALTAATKKIAQGNFNLIIKTRVRDEVGQLASSFNTMAAQLDQATKELVEKEAIAKELELATKIQIDTLPKKLPGMAGMTVATSLTPATFVGGDSYDFIQLADGTTYFYVGDATGHGVPAGIIVSLLNAVIFDHANRGKDIKEILARANEVIRNKTSANTFATVLLVKWSPATSTLEFISAGHEPLIHYQWSNGQAEIKKQKQGMPIGIIPGLEKLLQTDSIVLQSGDTILVYSDGLVEARNEAGKMWNINSLQESLIKHAKVETDAASIQSGILKDSLAFRQSAAAADDITIITLRKS